MARLHFDITGGFLTGISVGVALTLTLSCFFREDKEKESSDFGEDIGHEMKCISVEPAKFLPDEFREEQLSRNKLFFGEEGMKGIKNCRILVVGVGGVGSHAAHMLARAGIGFMRLIDFDQVTLSSLNRHACATLEDVGIPKVICLKRFIQKVCFGHCDIDARVSMYTAKEEDDLMDGGPFDFIVDCIDDVPTKVQLLAYCIRTNTRVISCMSAGGKSDATRVHIGNLASACHDALATKIRVMLKRQKINVDNLDGDLVNAVYSSEKVVAKLAELSEEQQQNKGPNEFGAVENMRVRVLPVLGTMPAIMGQAMAAFVLCELGQKPFSPLSGERMGRSVRHRTFQHLKNREKAIRTKIESEAGIKSNTNETETKSDKENDEEDMSGSIVNGIWIGPCQVDSDDVEYLLAEVWRMRCAVTQKRMGVVLELIRWDMTKPSVCGNLVLLSKGVVKQMDDSDFDNSFIPQEVQDRIQRRLAWSKVDSWS